MPQPIKVKSVYRVSQSDSGGRIPAAVDDYVAVEDPLEIRLVAGPSKRRRSKAISITMRTPGEDFDLAIGFLVSEGVIENLESIQQIEYCGRVAPGEENSNIIGIDLVEDVEFDWSRLQRNFYTTSSCGVCGKASLEALASRNLSPVGSTIQIEPNLVYRLPAALKKRQKSFAQTGGIHAAGLFSADGQLLHLSEDVGRHNAVDKLIGRQFQAGRWPLEQQIVVVSARASFELLQKSLVSRAEIFLAVGAPSSLAVELAEKFNITLIGFAGANRFNIYSHPWRIQ